MSFDNDPILETDQLEQLLEAPSPAPPVVVVQYRNRGIPPWIFFLVIFLIPAAAIVLYHRLVVVPDRIQAARDRSSILRKIEADRANEPLVRETGASTTILPDPGPATSVQGTGDDSGSSPGLTAAALAQVVNEMKGGSVSNPPNPGADVTGSAAPSPASRLRNSSPNPSGIIGQSGPIPHLRPVAADSAGAGKPAASNVGIGVTSDVGKTEKAVPAASGNLVGESVQGGVHGQQPTDLSDNRQNGSAADSSAELGTVAGASAPDTAVAGQEERVGLKPLPPLPTAEEAQRQIEEEADRRNAAIVAQFENRDAELRSKRLEEQMKFRQELAEVVRSKGNQAGPDIANLDKRYGYQGDPVTYQHAYQMWRNSRRSQKAKVEYVRSLELPETAILEFMCSSLHGSIGTRSGPRDENEVRVRAAKLLLQYPLAAASPGPRPENGNDAGATSASKKVVSTPR